MPHVLIADDEKNIRATLARALRLEGYRTSEAGDGALALEALEQGEIDLVLLDVQMPKLDGLGVLAAMRERGLAVPAIVLTAHGSIERAVCAVKLGAFDFIEKPPSVERILVAIGNALDRGRLETENRRLTEATGTTGEILGDAEATRALRQTLARVAPTAATVLLLGENGTGKELAARAIHAGSPRARKPFVVLNCAAIPETLFESELYGHMKGAFTGATEARRGKFQQADGGTLFLDEIGETPIQLQPKLLRSLETGDVETIGGRAPERVDVRVVAATNRDLAKEVEAGRFRRDLYYRLAVVPVPLPPLRARSADIVPLAARFLAAACRDNRVRAKRLDAPAEAALTRHAWPGNVRELKNVMERAAILVQDDVVREDDLELPVAHVVTDTAPTAEGGRLADQLVRHERAIVLAALEKNHWRMTKTADDLGLERSHLYKKLKALGIEKRVED
ncbi:MAG TPA: sigma-54 dependent transcriptional regulator [Candidatus Polarisedimenticolaceae bacterium]|nr:sigma-54 dependent transcriptional regulator [Candidatus Polarisedimenticolaceae bacterium]